ncbi:hypothetical protein [Kamptonema sp. UHCC 0994]|uniref:hypothetical protein n=1 Tax=Kamptonema sp. UHCC 0994 TaxID=3031329 RepID=UPI0023B92FCE|nr:hypothetical protein [Kamptonema sp. UHCC 0994]MDF0552114.1 hypothetical protein [Kamptonema sp. UHCC 0994]
MGKDICHKFSDRTITELDQILSQILEDSDRYFPPLIPRSVEGNEWDSKFDKIFQRWSIFYEGMKAT